MNPCKCGCGTLVKGDYKRGHYLRVSNPNKDGHSRRGKQHSQESIDKNREAHLGKKASPETIEKLRIASTGRKHSLEDILNFSGENSGRWKGDDVGYIALHTWMRKHLPKPEFCQICEKVSPVEIACITGIYNRDFENWQWVCISCHRIYDYDNIKDPISGKFISKK